MLTCTRWKWARLISVWCTEGSVPSKVQYKPKKFEFLHLSILREYLQEEFKELAATLPFVCTHIHHHSVISTHTMLSQEFSLERVIDDLVMLCYLAGMFSSRTVRYRDLP